MNRIKWSVVLSFFILFSCTHEYVEEVKNSWRIDVAISFADPQFWPEGQQMRVGVFDTYSSNNVLKSVLINRPSDSTISVSMSDVAEGAYRLKLYLTEAGIYKADVADLGLLEVIDNSQNSYDDIRLLTYERVQKQVFNGCQLCHGGSSGDIAANLNLTADHSYSNLVGVDAHKFPSMKRVLPGSSDYSYLINVLNKNIDFDHPASSSATAPDRQLIIDWIKEGAKND